MHTTDALFTLGFPSTPCSSHLVMRSIHKLAGSFFNRHAVEACASSTPCRHMVSDLFHSPPGVLFTFPSRYLFTIGLKKYVALPVSSGRFAQAIRVLSYSRTIKKLFRFRLQGFHLLERCFPAASAITTICNFVSFKMTIIALQPREFLKLFDCSSSLRNSTVWARFAFARRY